MTRDTKYTSSGKYHCLEYLKRNSVELYLNYCGKEACEPGHSYGPDTRSEYLLHYVLKGHGTFTCADKTYKINEHDAFLILPEEVTTYCADSQDPWTYVWIGFNGTKAEDCLRQAGFTGDFRVRHFQNSEYISERVNDILNAHHLTYAHDLIRQSNLMLLLSEMIQEYQEIAPQTRLTEYPHQTYVEYATEFIEWHLHENIKVTDIANYVGLDRSYLTKLFKKTFDLSPQDYLINLRLSKAATLLKTTDHTISQIAEMVGYNTSLAFTKAFKSKYSISPGAYRNASEEIVYSSKKGEK